MSFPDNHRDVPSEDSGTRSCRAEKESNYDFLRRASQAYKQILEQAGQIVVGQQSVLEGLVIAMVSRGHCLLEGGPGMAKMTILSTLAKLFGLGFHRISLTPDMTPHDIVSLETDGQRASDGTPFANILLIEEINCAQPKTQMTLLNAIQDEQITLGHTSYPLPKPFFVVATETPIERDRIAPLTASQLDRFMMKLVAGYPTFEEEFELVRRMATLPDHVVQPVFSSDELLRLQELIPRTPVSDGVAEFAVSMIRKTRVEDPAETFEFVPQQVARGAGTNSLHALIRAAQARAILSGRSRTAKNDVWYVSKLVLRHRLVMQPNASLSSDDIIDQLD
ncbi:MAG: MoxR family ATPase [Planctomycetaceae bacterium]|nr:MoxR family ATPase [Planctomycetaceae bacterium]